MKQCTKCKVEKELDKFQTYWHSTQNKNRTRAECTECLYKQRNERKRLRRLKKSKLIQVPTPTEIIEPEVPELHPEILEDYSNNPNYKQCRTCQEWKLKEDYYLHKSKQKTAYLDCRVCINKKEHQRSKNRRLKYIEENGGGKDYFKNPGEWIDDYQKESTHNILKAMGWELNEENGIWWKEGVKSKEGIFNNVKTFQTLRKKYQYAPKIRIKPNKLKMFDDVIRLRLQGHSYEMIGYKIGISDTTVFKWVKEYEANKG